MGKMEQTLRSEIRRLAKKEVRAVCDPLIREVRALRREVRNLRKTVATVGEAVPERAAAGEPSLQADPEEVDRARFSPGLIRKLRKRHHITQADLAKLLGVSPAAVAFWEQGRSRPRHDSKTRIVALRKLGRRDVRRLLEAST